MHAITRSLLEAFKRKQGGSGRDLLGYMSGFVQNLEYRIPESPRRLPWNPLRKITTCGVTMPLETLYNGWGDCDSKSVLLAALFSNLKKAKAVFVEGESHVFIGVAGSPRRNDHFIKHRNIRYILIETTTPWPLGRISRENWQAARANQFSVYPVN